jgi:GAF domain-containing protein
MTIEEEKRIQALEQFELLDTLPEKEFDDIVELASAFFHTPISLISLLDSHRQWFKARIGMAAKETPIEQAFCYHAIKDPDHVMVVPDSLMDDRFINNPLATGSPHVRFYAGAPLVTRDGYALGTLCVIDSQPRNFSEEQERVLQILAHKVIERMENRKNTLTAKKYVEQSEKNKEQYIAALEETLYALSHKVRKPVATVIGMTQQIVKGELNEDEQKEYTNILKKSALELDEYIHELNDFIHQKKIKINRSNDKSD